MFPRVLFRTAMVNLVGVIVAAFGQVQSAGKVPMGWEEVYTTTGAAKHNSGVVLATWDNFNARQAAVQGFDAVECAQSHFYIQEPIHYSKLWYDISEGANHLTPVTNTTNHDSHTDGENSGSNSNAAKRNANGKGDGNSTGTILGGEVSMWGNPWCFAGVNCTRNDAAGQKPPAAGWMYVWKVCCLRRYNSVPCNCFIAHARMRTHATCTHAA